MTDITPIVTSDPEWVDRVTWAADRLARIYSHGFEQGLRGEKLSVPLEGSPEMWAAKKRGYAAGIARRAELAKPPK
jgi:ribosome modulation factor